MKIITIGHSNRSIDSFLEILKNQKIDLLVDVRQFPTSKFEQFKGENLEKHLQQAEIKYLYLGHLLVGSGKVGMKSLWKRKNLRQELKP